MNNEQEGKSKCDNFYLPSLTIMSLKSCRMSSGKTSRLRRPLDILRICAKGLVLYQGSRLRRRHIPAWAMPTHDSRGEELHVSVRSYTDMSGALPRPPYFYTWALPTYKSRIRGKLQQQYKKILMYSKKTHFFRDLIVIIL